jgi:predicted transposase YdaD
MAALQAEVVQPRQLPDGLIEALLQGQLEPSLFVLELATYPESRIAKQVVRDMTLVYLDRRIVPDVITLVLHPKGNLQVTGSLEMMSPGGMTHWSVRWKVVQLWSIPAETLLDAHDVGLIPWVPLTHEGSPEPIFQQCRARIDQQALPEERENLLAVTQVLAGLRYNEVGLFQLLGGRDAMIESPVLQELKAEWTREAAREAKRRAIVDFLVARFGSQAEEFAARLETIDNDARLKELVKLAAVCSDLESFRNELAA